MPYLTQLADIARRTGHPVTEVPGWKSRGHGEQPAVEGIVCHHTAGPAGGGDYPSLNVVKSGRTDLPGPLSHFGLGRSGRIYVIAAGRCWHNAPSTSPLHDNSSALGIEAENDGRQAWPSAQLDAYRKLCAELCRAFDLPATRVKAHREVNKDKPDPHGIDMNTFRATVARLIKNPEDNDMPKHTRLAKKEETRLARGEWTQVPYGDTWTLAGGGGAQIYSISAGVHIDGLKTGDEYQVRLAEYEQPAADKPWRLLRGLKISEHFHGVRAALAVHSDQGRVPAKRRIRLEVRQWTSDNARVVAGSADVLTWPG